MLFCLTFAVYLISHGYIVNASYDEKETKYFVDKEIFDETRKRDKLQRLKFFNGKRKLKCIIIHCIHLDF